MHIQGIIKGKHITLTHETGLPEGVLVMIAIQYNPLSLEQKRNMVDRLCGSWASDSSISPIFQDIEEQRHTSQPREVTFDATS